MTIFEKHTALLAVLTTGLAVHSGSFAAEMMAPVVISASRTAQEASDLPLKVKVISGESMASAPVLDAALREDPAFSLFRRTSSLTANPTAQGVSLRGIGPSGASRSLVLLDGVPLNDPFGGWITWSQVPRLALGSAQIVHGGGSGAWGNAALGGVVALETGPLVAPVGKARLEAGDFETLRGETSIAQPVSAGFLRLDVSGFSTGGAYAVADGARGPVDRPFDSEHHVAQLSWRQPLHDSLQVKVTGRIFSEQRGNGTPLQKNESWVCFASVAVSDAPRPGLSWDGVLYAHAQGFESFFSSVGVDRASELPANDQFDVPASAGGMAFTMNWRRDDRAGTAAGFDVRRVAGETREDFLYRNGRFAQRRYAGGTQAFGGLFVHHDRALLERMRVSVDLRVDRWENRDGHLREHDLASGAPVRLEAYADRSGHQFSPRAGWVWQLSDASRLRTSAYRAFRVPTLNEYYRPFRVGTTTTQANPLLGIETLDGAELGVETRVGRVRLGATGYVNELHDAVSNVTLSSSPAGITRQRRNLDEVRVRGVELSVEWPVSTSWQLRADYLWSDARVTMAREQPALVGRRLAQVPEHKVTAGVDWAAPSGWRLGGRLRWTDRQFEDDENVLVLHDATTVDLTFGRRLGSHLDVFASVENAFDERVESSRSPAGFVTYDVPRQARVGMQVSW